METVRFRLNLSAEQMHRYYEGVARQVMVRVSDGRRVQFPAQWLRRFVTRDGVSGLFQMRFSENWKLIDLQRIED
ncbi:MAG: DUF2835 domain-containing protein [Gammaproteobacteria bacterium]|nr:DUF2835 domain-containing protein [Gammaproteobacteria bacterium]